jgi:hypothetical protein
MSHIDQLQTRLTEALDDLYACYVDPREPYFDDDTRWLALGAAEQRQAGACSAPLDEAELAALRAECRGLALQNEFAINALENRVSFLVGAGHKYTARPRKGRRAAPQLVADAQAIIDEFVRVNRWAGRQQETALRLDRDGEVFLRLFTGADGVTRVRFIEPGQVYAPAAATQDPSASFGIATEPDDVETVLAYFIDGSAVDASSIQHRKANVDANVKRGLPLFTPVRKNLRRAEKLLRNMSTVAEIQSAIALIRKHHGATRTAVQQFVANSGTPAVGGGGASPRSESVRRYAPGTILDAYGNVEYDFPAAALDASSYVAVLQAELRAIAARLVMPEFMLSADASNGNYASSLVAESPALRTFERLQARQMADDEELLRRVLENAAAAGRLDRAASEVVELQIEGPSMSVRDGKQEAETRAIEFAHGVLSAQTWAMLAGYDYEREQANIAAAQQAKMPGNTPV